MRYLSSNEIRNIWLNFFKEKGHHIEEGASLIPVNDPTLLWINAGVAALKKYFDGSVIPTNPRICNVQKAIRTNDIENVGHTARHHTFFEMMGNFSIGDYFKFEAIEFAFELLTSEKYFAIPLEKLYITYFPEDKDTYNKWVMLGVDPSHMIPCEGNFWEIGEGPCGPDSEIFFDRGEKYDPNNLGIELLKNDIENDRYIEIWNIVFSQFNSKPGVKRSDYKELPHKNIDTGAGLERFCCIMQDAETNYETDLFYPIIKKCESLAKHSYVDEYKTSYKIIADHLRTCTFALADGASFSNEGRGYVLRRLLRRAVRHGKKLGIEHEFLALLVDEVINIMKDFYPYLLEKAQYIKNLITIEERKFLEKLIDGEKILNDLYNKNHCISGEDAFLLYDTYGYPFEITLEFAQEHNITIDKSSFDAAMNRQKELARGSRGDRNSMKSQNLLMMDFKDKSEFVGYDTLKVSNAKVIGIFKEDNKEYLVTDKTPFYAEMGGEIGDCGIIYNNNFKASVNDCLKMPNGQHMHLIQIMQGSVNIGDIVNLEVNEQTRKSIELNHSATHLFDQALRDVLGNHVYQHGSLVTAKNIRFDFNHFENVSNEQLLALENIVKEKIALKLEVKKYELPLQEAKKEGCISLFGEKYGNIVRIVNIGGYSKEFCGGCHTNNTENIIDFAIASIESKGSGIFRVQAVTGNNVIEKIIELNQNIFDEYEMLYKKYLELLSQANNAKLNVLVDKDVNYEKVNSYQMILNIKNAIVKLKENIKSLDKSIKNSLNDKMVSSFDYKNVDIKNINGINLIFVTLSIDDGSQVKQIADNLQNEHPDCLIFVMSVSNEKVLFVAKANKAINDKGILCGNLVKKAAMLCGGNGGGRNDFAQAGGKDVLKACEVKALIEGLL
ncbi:MAG: alanine--tRNA ligase [Erysipelotrichaceae bacterium]|nr:alanine--tRNA ligase [Erysipelotrichaceae bacterium]